MLYNSEYQPTSATGGVLGTSLVDLTSVSFADLFAQAADYSAATVYNKGTLAYSQNTIWVYINTTASSGNPPPTLPTISNIYWELVGSAGTFTWIAYASSADGATNFTTNTYDFGGIIRTFIGIANNKTSAVESGIYTDYSWSKFVGTDGAPGASAKSMVVTTDRQLITFDSSGLLSPTLQNINLTANKQNTTATVNWTIKDTAGNVLTPSSYLNNTAGDTTQMTGAQFRNALLVNGAQGLVITATLIDGVTIVDTVTVMKLQAAVNGVSALSAYITSEAQSLFAYANGNVVSFANANGLFKIYSGTVEVTSSATGFSATASGCTGTINTAAGVPVAGQPIGYYRVTAMSADIATLTLSATYSGTTFTKIYSLSKTRGGYEILATLPTTDLFEGRVVFLTTDDKLYRYTGTVWVTSVPATDISGTLADAQISALAASKVTGQLSDSQLAAIAAAKISGQITTIQITDAAITTAKFSSGIEPITSVTSIPTIKSTNTIFNSTDGKLYRWNGSAYIASTPSTDITGTLTDAQLAAISAAKITGTLTDAQLAAISAAKITGTLTDAQLAAISAAKITGTLTDTQLAAISAAKVTGTLTDAQLAAISAAKITGTLTDAQLAAISIAKVKGAVGGGNLLSNTNFKNITGTINTDGSLPFGWGVYNNLGISVTTRVASGGLFGTNFIRITALAPTNSSFGIFTQQGQYIWTPGLLYVISFWARAGSANVVGKTMASTYSNMGFSSSVEVANPGLLQNTWQRYITVVNPANNASTAQGELFLSAVIGSWPYSGILEICGVQVEQGELVSAYAPRVDEILPGTITSTEIANDAITSPKIIAGAITAGKIAADSITANEIAANAITASELAAGSVIAGKIAASSITASELAAGSVTAGKIAADSITANEIAANAITASELAAGSVIAGKIAADSITANEIAANSITASELAAGSVTAGKIAADSITANEIAANAITASELAAGSVIAGKIAADSITASEIAANSITASELAAGSVTAGKIAAGTITASELAAGSVIAGKIAANSITASELAAGSVTAGKIAADSITASEIAANAITASELAAGSITTAKLAAGAVTAATIAANTITASQIAANSITASEIATNAITADEISSGAVTAAKISVTQLSAITATIGTLRTATTGARTEISDNVIKVFDASNVLRVRIGNLTL